MVEKKEELNLTTASEKITDEDVVNDVLDLYLKDGVKTLADATKEKEKVQTADVKNVKAEADNTVIEKTEKIKKTAISKELPVSPKAIVKSYGTFPYNNRELSWMDFNYRVLEEAMEHENPVLERVNFLAITASNLDEFFMVRVAGVLDQIHEGITRPDASGLTPAQVFQKLTEKIHFFAKKQYSSLTRSILPELQQNGLKFVSVEDLNNKQISFINKYFDDEIFPVLTPLAVDTSRPFPLLSNKSLNIAVLLQNSENESVFAVIQVPSIIPRFLELPFSEDRSFILLENIIMYKLQELFELYKIVAYTPFRITRDSDLEIDEEADDLLIEIQNSIKKRKRGKPVRLEISKKCDSELREFLVSTLEVTEAEIYEHNGPLDLTFLSKFGRLSNCDNLRFSPIIPVSPPSDFYGYDDIFEAIRVKDRMVHHPYESFDSVLKFITKAAEDSKVLAIKQTLYRVSGNSPIIAALIKAAENGKQVTVLVELKARFDEENNIQWAKKLEKAGCHVIYGLTGLKTHCKICLVVRKESDGMRRYLHMGTGNYNDSTARFYTDIGMFTCKEEYGIDASSLFNVLTGYSIPPEYNKFIVAPTGMRSFFENMIIKEIDNQKMGLPSGITVKVNSLVDPALIKLLYAASQAGVKITLIVRGVCSLIPGLKGFSENITVYSIVGQLLEHSRIFKFENGGQPVVYMGSADWMPRNLDRRVELVFPIEDEQLKERSFRILELMLSDTVNARIQNNDSSYTLIDKRGKRKINSQLEFSRMAKKILKSKTKKAIDKNIGTPRYAKNI
ncbi:MAG TPA: RNA degradosome polyphosphate kinase [Clostridiales bacterium]|nr:RNA degradosome polyphosphate kinase [Clostridiales bacterium]